MSPTARIVVQSAAKAALIVVLGVSLSHCGKKPEDTTKPSTTAYAYDVALTLTPKAVKALGDKKIVVDGFYFGAPTAGAKDKADEAGRITLGEDESTVDAKDQTIHLTGFGLDRVVLANVEGGQPSVEITAYSETTAKNVLKCTTFKDTIKAAQAKPVAISCDAAK